MDKNLKFFSLLKNVREKGSLQVWEDELLKFVISS